MSLLLDLASALRIGRAGHSLARWGALSLLSLLLLLVFWRAPLASAQPAATTLGALTTAYDGTPQLSWGYSGVAGFSSYKIYRDTAPGVSQTSTLVSTLSNRSTTSFNDTTAKPQVAPGATFYYSVAVVATNGTTLSNERSITLINAPPAPVTLGTPTANTQNGPVNLSWSQSNENDFASYKVYRGTAPGVTPTNGTLLTTSTYRDSESNTDGYTDTTATYAVAPGASYYYIVVVTDSAGQTSTSNEKSITLTNLPPVAVTLSAPSVATYQPSGPVSLSWTQSGEFDFASYSLYRGTTAGVTPANGTLVKTITSKYTTSYIDTGVAFSVAPGTTYYYVVVVSDSAGQVAPSNERSITLINQPPAAVTLSAPTIGANNPNGPVYLSWSQSPEYDFASYKVYRATSPNVTPQNSTLLSTSTYRDSESDTDGYTDTTATYSVAPGTTYYYMVVVTDSAGQTSTSNEKSITLINRPPVAVTLKTVTSSGPNGPVNLSWTQSPEYDFKSYNVYRGTSAGVTPVSGTLMTTITTKTTLTYTDTTATYSVAPGTTYYYVVSIADSAGQTAISNENSVTLINQPPAAVTLGTPTAATQNGPVNLSWSQSQEFDVASYKVYRGTSPGVTPQNGTLLSTITTRDSESDTDGYSDSKATYAVAPGATYYYIVVVTDSAGQTSVSNEKSITLTNLPPVAVTLNAPTANTQNGPIQLSWSQSNEFDFASYKVYRRTSPGVTPQNGTLLATITTRDSESNTDSYLDKAVSFSPAPGTSYYYIVVVTDSAGQTSISNEKSITLTNLPPVAVTLNNPVAGAYPDSPGVSLNWTQSNEFDFASYKVYRGTAPGVTAANGTLLATITTRDSESNTDGYTDTTATYTAPPGTTYYYVVVVVDSAGQTSTSNEKSVVLLDAPPVAVTLAPANSRRLGVNLSWSQNADKDFASYKVYLSTTPGVTMQNGTLLTTITLATTSTYTDSSVPLSPPPGVTLYYRVFVVDRGGQVTGSNEVSVQRVDTPYNGTIVYGNNASSGTVTIEAFYLDTGELFDQFVVPNAEASADNGRGIAVVGDTIYYTTANSGKVYKMNKTTHADGGVAFDTHLNGIACLSWDGTALWLIPYNGANDAYRFTPAGTLLQIVSGFGNSRDGFEIANSYIICNRGDEQGPYDLYSLDGTLVQASFINPNFAATGITFDGNKFIVSKLFGNSAAGSQLAIYNANGTLDHIVDLDGPYPHGQRLLEDLSALGNIPSNTLAEPGTR